MRLSLIVLALALVSPEVAMAASFDCGKARTPFAKAICTHPDLSKADEKLAAAFKAALQGLSPAARTEVSTAQDAWVKFANRACTGDARPATKPYAEDALACLGGVFSDRLEQLRSSRTIGGLRFYYIDRYAALKDTESGDEFAKVATKSVSTPRIDGNTDEAQAFNRFIETETRDEVDPAMADDPAADTSGEDDANAITVTYVNPARITMTVNTSMYGHGAAHGNYAVTYIHYLRGEGRRLEASDIFEAEGWEAQLQERALAAVKAQEGENLMLDDPGSINDLVTDPARWDFSREGLVLQFEPYEIAPYAAGAPTVTIPWSELEDLLAPGYRDAIG
jgi:uncharacterized protein